MADVMHGHEAIVVMCALTNFIVQSQLLTKSGQRVVMEPML